MREQETRRVRSSQSRRSGHDENLRGTRRTSEGTRYRDQRGSYEEHRGRDARRERRAYEEDRRSSRYYEDEYEGGSRSSRYYEDGYEGGSRSSRYYEGEYEGERGRSSRHYDDEYEERRRRAAASGKKRKKSSGGRDTGNKKKRKKRKHYGRFFLFFLILLMILTVGGVFGGMVFFEKQTGQTLMECIAEGRVIAAQSSAEDFEGGTKSHLYAAGDKKIADLSLTSEAVCLTYDELPMDVVNAFVAVEDRTFWTNNGTDSKGIFRVMFNFVRSGGKKMSGASTITQQLVKLTYLSSEKTLSRKVKEMVISREITGKYTKKEIMAFYSNACCFANAIYGIADASEAYFGKKPKELTLSECAYLCAIPNRPEYYNPRTNPEHAMARRDKILNDMLHEGYITQKEHDEAIREEIKINMVRETVEDYNYETSYALNCAAKYLMKRADFVFRYSFDDMADYKSYQEQYKEALADARHEIYTGGYSIYTSIDLDVQNDLQEVVDDALSSHKERTGDGIYQLQGALTAIDNGNGKVVAIIGGRTEPEKQGALTLNRGYQGFAQPGSSIKPLVVYAPAMDTGKYNTGSLLQNISVSTAKGEKKTAAQIREMKGESRTLKNAVENSLNGCAYWLFSQIGIKTGMSYLKEMEFSRIVPDDYNMSACLGGLSIGVSTEEMANAYYTLANNGRYKDTDCILSIKDRNGNEIYEEAREKQVYAMSSAQRMTTAMMGVLTRGTAKRSDWYSHSKTDACGKTGTTNDNKEGWFCGYTPYYSIAVWVGCDTPTPVQGLDGSSFPLTIWEKAMLRLIRDLPAAHFQTIQDVEETLAVKCTCSVLCDEDHVDSHCELCLRDYNQCAASAGECICEEKCEGDSLNENCPVCMRDVSACEGSASLCSCQSRCTADHVNADCLHCLMDYTACQGFSEDSGWEEDPGEEPENPGEEQDPEGDMIDPPEPDEWEDFGDMDDVG